MSLKVIINVNDISEDNYLLYDKEDCNVEVGVLDKLENLKIITLINYNCDDGKFHKFSLTKIKRFSL